MKMFLFAIILFVTSLATAQDSTLTFRNENPCEDKLFLQLQAKDSLSIDEMKIYVELKRDCENYINDETKSGSDSTLALGLITAFALIFGLILLLQ